MRNSRILSYCIIYLFHERYNHANLRGKKDKEKLFNANNENPKLDV